MSIIQDRKTALKKKLMGIKPNTDNPKEDGSNTFFLVAIWAMVLFSIVANVWLSILNDRRSSYIYKVTVGDNRYQCNVIERGNPTYLKDCWQGNSIVIYDPVNMVIIE